MENVGENVHRQVPWDLLEWDVWGGHLVATLLVGKIMMNQ